jgi:hypothetical protein
MYGFERFKDRELIFHQKAKSDSCECNNVNEMSIAEKQKETR